MVVQHPVEYASGSGIKRKTAEQRNHPFEIETVSTAFKNAVKTYKIKFTAENDNIETAIAAMEGKLSNFRADENSLKFSMAIHVEFEKATDPDVVTDPPVVLQSEQFEVYHDTSIQDQLDKVAKQLNKNIEVYEQCGSGWILKRVVALDTTIWKLNPLRGSTFHELPKWIIDKRAVINVRNHDAYCFKWSVLAALHQPTSKTQRNLTSSYTAYESKYDFSGLKFPVSLRQISIFENKNNLSVNVYGIDEVEKGKPFVYPLKVASHEQTKHVNLLLTEENGVMHYSTISRFSRLVRSQCTKDSYTYEYCYSCLQGFKLQKDEKERGECKMLEKHQKYCKTLKPQRTEFPTKEKAILKFTNVQKQLKAPFVMYADFEAPLMNKTDEKRVPTFIKKDGTEPEKKKKKEAVYQEHQVVSYAFKIVSIDPEFEAPIEIYRGVDAVDRFLSSAQQKAKEIFEKYICRPKPQPRLTPEEKQKHNAETHCHI